MQPRIHLAEECTAVVLFMLTGASKAGCTWNTCGAASGAPAAPLPASEPAISADRDELARLSSSRICAAIESESSDGARHVAHLAIIA